MALDAAQSRLIDEVVRRYGVAAAAVRIVFAPYRVCPLGAHIDHQLGSVTALAIDQGVRLAYAASTERVVRLSSLDFPGEVRCDFAKFPAALPGDWGNYIRGAVRVLQQAGYVLERGFVGVTAGAWSEGGLGSSAAVGVAYLLALEAVNDLEVTAQENLRLDQAIENDYLGLRNGLLDQAGVLLSRQGHLTLIHCATAEHLLVPPPAASSSWAILVAFSGLRQALGRTDYNRRVTECAEAARLLLACAGRSAAVPLLGNVTEPEYLEHQNRLSGPPARRAAHFFSESARVRRGVVAWQRGDWAEFGQLMTASGDSSIRNYECGCPPLIDLYEILVSCRGVYGARFSGAGFRGCCVAWVAGDAADRVAGEVRDAYARRQPALAAQAAAVVCHSDDGARLLEPEQVIQGGVQGNQGVKP
jgi:galacturonokinase